MRVRWPLMGRNAELDLITDVIEGATYRGLVIAGSAGVGKTRLAAEAADAAAARGWSVKQIVGTATGRAIPLGAFVQWADGEGGTSLAVAQRVTDAMIGSSDAPVLLAVDDAHLLDELSVFVLFQFVLRDLGAVILTVRAGEPVADAITKSWKDELLYRLELQPLSRAKVGRLLCSALGGEVADECTDGLWELTRGNVLLLRHLVEQELTAGHLTDEGCWRWTGGPTVSPPLRELVELQIGAVPEAVRHVVDLVAVAETIDRRCLNSLTDPGSLEEADRRGLLTTTASDQVRVGHPLYAEVRLAQAGPLTLRRLRGQVAAAINDRPHDSFAPDPIRLGLLWLDSDLEPDPKVLSHAAQASLARMDGALAERFAPAAVAAGGGNEARVQHAYALGQLGRGEEARAVLDDVNPADVPASGFVNEVTVRAYAYAGPLRQPDEALRIVEEALAESVGARTHQLLAFRGIQLLFAGRPTEVLEVIENVDFDQLDGFGQSIAYCVQCAALAEVGEVSAAAAKAAAGYLVIESMPGEVYHAAALGETHAGGLLFAGYLDEAAIVAEQQFQRYRDNPGVPRSTAVGALGIVALGTGDLASARRYLDPDELDFDPQQDLDGMAYPLRIVRTEMLARSGDAEGAASALDLATTIRHPGMAYLEPSHLLAEAWVSAASGRVSAARERSLQAAAIARERGQRAREVVCLQTATQFGDLSAAGRLHELTTLVEGPRATLAARYARALADQDSAGLDSVSSDLEAMGDRLAAADAAGHAALAYRAEGKRGSSLTASARAERLSQACGGATSPAIVEARVAPPFTRREREVATLVSQGLTNRAVAEELCLSVRTVEGYIYRACVKAGVATRSELAKLVAGWLVNR